MVMLMILNRRIKLGTNIYYIKYECSYKYKNNINVLYLNNNNSYDGGNLSILINEVEKRYDKNIVKDKYKIDIPFLIDVLYIYEYIPFIKGIGDISIDKNDNSINEVSYISKEELDSIIKDNNILIENNSKFDLCNQTSWNIFNFNNEGEI